MNKINFKGVTPEAVTNVLILLAALINAILQMFGINPLPIADTELSALVSALFLIITSLWNTWKNRNFSNASQIAQSITDSLKKGELLAEDVTAFIHNFKNRQD